MVNFTFFVNLGITRNEQEQYDAGWNATNEGVHRYG